MHQVRHSYRSGLLSENESVIIMSLKLESCNCQSEDCTAGGSSEFVSLADPERQLVTAVQSAEAAGVLIAAFNTQSASTEADLWTFHQSLHPIANCKLPLITSRI